MRGTRKERQELPGQRDASGVYERKDAPAGIRLERVGSAEPKPLCGVRPEVVRALAAMKIVADFARHYVPGEPVPPDIWEEARTMGDYLQLPPPEQWLSMWLNRREPK